MVIMVKHGLGFIHAMGRRVCLFFVDGGKLLGENAKDIKIENRRGIRYRRIGIGFGPS